MSDPNESTGDSSSAHDAESGNSVGRSSKGRGKKTTGQKKKTKVSKSIKRKKTNSPTDQNKQKKLKTSRDAGWDLRSLHKSIDTQLKILERKVLTYEKELGMQNRVRKVSVTAVDQVEHYRRNKMLRAFSTSKSRPPLKKRMSDSDAHQDLSRRGGIPLDTRKRYRLEDMLRDLTPEQTKIGSCLVWCFDHSESAEEVVNCFEEALSILQTPIPTKEAVLTVISLLVSLCNTRATNASAFIRTFERKLLGIFSNVREVHKKIDAGVEADQFQEFVLSCLKLWEYLSVYTADFLNRLQLNFLDVVPVKTFDSPATPMDSVNCEPPPTATSPPSLLCFDADLEFSKVRQCYEDLPPVNEAEGVSSLEKEARNVCLKKESKMSSCLERAKAMNKTINGLTEAECLSLSMYAFDTSDDAFFGELNAAALKGEWKLYAVFCSLLTSAILKLSKINPLSKDTRLFRGLNLKVGPPKCKQLFWKTFCSASMDINVAKLFAGNDGTILEFMPPASSYSSLIDTFSTFNEQEVILLPFESFEFLGAEGQTLRFTSSNKQELLNPEASSEGGVEGDTEADREVLNLNRAMGLRPLENPGFLCYANCIVQCLSNVAPLLYFCLDKSTSVNKNLSELVKEFIRLICSIWQTDQRGVPVSAKPFKKEVSKVLKAFDNDRQHDAQDFMIQLLVRLALDYGCEKDIFSETFSGLQRSSVTCQKCGTVSDSYETFWTLSLSLDTVKTQMSLADCFQMHCLEESLDENNKVECSKCCSHQLVNRQLSITKFPPVLVLHLKRFDKTLTTRRDTRVSSPVSGLDLSEFASIAASQKVRYNLIGVCNHSGSPTSGHYWCVGKHPGSKMWHEFNNFSVKLMALDELDSSDPYVYFYELQQNEVDK